MAYEVSEILADLPAGPGLLTAVGAAEDALARLDERLRASPLRQGWIARTHFHDACASLYLAGELVHLEDLVLHDAAMDVRTPTHELTRAHAVLRARRRIAAGAPGDWLARGIDALRGQDRAESGEESEPAPLPSPNVEEDPLSAELAAIDAAIERSSHVWREGGGSLSPLETSATYLSPLETSATYLSPLETSAANKPGRELVYDEDWDEESGLASWRAVCDRTADLPATLAAAVAYEAWREIEPLQRQAWLGSLLVADLLRARGKALAHLPCLDGGLVLTPRQRRRHKDRGARILAALEAITASARAGLAEHDRLALARSSFERRCAGLRSNARLPALAELAVSRPMVSAPMIARELGVSARAALDMVSALGLREVTGRGRFRAWAIL